ncbi:hypothetical protein V1522DRAFT_425125 [Lipomyces starkeyi]
MPSNRREPPTRRYNISVDPIRLSSKYLINVVMRGRRLGAVFMSLWLLLTGAQLMSNPDENQPYSCNAAAGHAFLAPLVSPPPLSPLLTPHLDRHAEKKKSSSNDFTFASRSWRIWSSISLYPASTSGSLLLLLLGERRNASTSSTSSHQSTLTSHSGE